MPFDPQAITAPFRMQPGLRRLAPGTPQLTPTNPGDAHGREKLEVLARHHSQALLSAPGFDAVPALDALCRQATLERPDAFAWDGDGRFDARALRWSVRGEQLVGDGPAEIGACLRALPPEWRLAGLLSLALAEDLAIIDGARAHIPWLAVCLPSHWKPEDKVGRHFAEVHGPVADNQLLVTAGAHLARLVTGTDRWERFVWTITRQSQLDAHPARHHALPWPGADEADAASLAALAFLRTERQTFIPLASAGQAIFTIHVELRPLAQALAEGVSARALHDAIASMSDAVLAYRNLTSARERLLVWLASRMAP